jgi:uncharacterized delta-60 repeat protein
VKTLAHLAASAVCWSLTVHAMVIDPVDPAFGVAIAEFATTTPLDLHRLAITPDGRIAGLTTQWITRAEGPACHAVTIVMFRASGEVDPSFGTSGRASAALLGMPPCVADRTIGFVVAPDGALLIAANPDGYPTTQYQPPRVWKTSASGVADASFGAGGSAALPAVESILRPTLQVLAGGGIAVGGPATFRDSVGQRTVALAVVRLRANGAADTDYGTQGVASAVPANRPIYETEGGGMAVNADGTTLVAGNIFEDDAGVKIYLDATVARFDAHGRLDTSYGDAGFAIPLRDASTYAQSLFVQAGEAYLAGIQSRDVPFAFVAKIKTNGQADLAFGDAGVAGTDQFSETNFDPQVAVDAARRVYLVVGDSLARPRVLRFTSDGRPDPGFGLDGAAYVAAQGWSFGFRPTFAVATGGTIFLGAGGFPQADAFTPYAIGVARLAQNGGHRADIAGGTAVIYYNAALDHYFLTANPAEQALLDNGTTVGWRRTGDTIRVVTSTGADPELSPVCRYYGRPEAHLDSHFFSAAPDECAAVARKFGASWLLETSQAFQVVLADPISGACPRGSEKIYRAFNNRADANHYYGRFAVAPPGWTYEGYGPGPVPTAFCAPLL